MKNKKLLILFVVLLILLIVISFIYFQISHPYFLLTTNGWNGCFDSNAEAIRQSNPLMCEFIKENGLQDPYYQNICREKCVKVIAYNTNNSQLCELINNFNSDVDPSVEWDDPRKTGSVKDYCYRDLAIKLGDKTLLNYLETDWAKNHFVTQKGK
ncbi:MAG: hypothetical protein WCW03_03850 [Candidatus Paceibacterota bacterium]|jgi:hypothetical protein